MKNRNEILLCIKKLKEINPNSKLSSDHPKYLKWVEFSEKCLKEIELFLHKYSKKKLLKDITILIHRGDVDSVIEIFQKFIEKQEQKKIIIETVMVILWGAYSIPFWFALSFIGTLGFIITSPITFLYSYFTGSNKKNDEIQPAYFFKMIYTTGDINCRRTSIEYETPFMKRMLSLLDLLFEFKSDMTHYKFYKIFILGRSYKKVNGDIEVLNERIQNFGIERLITLLIYVILPLKILIYFIIQN